MNGFDSSILHFLNQFARHSRLFDNAMGAITSHAVFKGWVLMSICWWVWFQPEKTAENRKVIIATLLSAVLAVVVGRLLADFMPFRLRPLQAPELGFIPPYGVAPNNLRNWSSFPSDHAMVFFAISTGLWFASRTVGSLATAYVALVIALPRIYVGYHYPTDVLAGALFGVLFACVANIDRVRDRIAAPAMYWLEVHPPSFYMCLFLFSQGLATLFDPLRHLYAALRSL